MVTVTVYFFFFSFTSPISFALFSLYLLLSLSKMLCKLIKSIQIIKSPSKMQDPMKRKKQQWANSSGVEVRDERVFF